MVILINGRYGCNCMAIAENCLSDEDRRFKREPEAVFQEAFPEMKITLETALELYSEGSYDENYERQSCEIIDETRWTMVHEIVFYDTATGKFWRFSIDNPKSENSSWDDYNDQLIDCNEVVPREKTVIVYDSV